MARTLPGDSKPDGHWQAERGLNASSPFPRRLSCRYSARSPQTSSPLAAASKRWASNMEVHRAAPGRPLPSGTHLYRDHQSVRPRSHREIQRGARDTRAAELSRLRRRYAAAEAQPALSLRLPAVRNKPHQTGGGPSTLFSAPILQPTGVGGAAVKCMAVVKMGTSSFPGRHRSEVVDQTCRNRAEK